MNKEPKYKIGDKLWVIDEHRVIGVSILGVQSTSIAERQKHFRHLVGFKYLVDTGLASWKKEKHLFSTKEELIKSL